MGRRFHKMQGLGNDFVVFDARVDPLALSGDQVRRIADRRLGVGCDQLIAMEPSETADVKMRIYNADGGEVGACGNASRCIAMLLGGDTRIETGGGMPDGTAAEGGATVDLGPPRFDAGDIPLAYAMDAAALPVGWEQLDRPFAVNVGNPHLVFFVGDVDAVDLGRLGPLIEHDPLFPERINVNVASVADGALRLRTWERGAGLTPACGTGAAASAVAAIGLKLLPSPVAVHQAGGTVTIEWAPGGTVRMTGPAAEVFTGEIAL